MIRFGFAKKLGSASSTISSADSGDSVAAAFSGGSVTP
jgi:hypothetical protein